MNDIAARAGVGKAAIYRRWSSKAALMADALLYWRPDLFADDAPDTGSWEGDLDEIVERAARNDDKLITNDLVLRVALEATHDPELTSALNELLVFRGRRVMTAVLDQALRRGDVASRDWSLVADTLTALGLMRIVSGQTVDAAYIRDVIDTLILPAVRESGEAVTHHLTGAKSGRPKTGDAPRRRHATKPQVNAGRQQ
jgi:AcrR family transcriptional regulator